MKTMMELRGELNRVAADKNLVDPERSGQLALIRGQMLERRKQEEHDKMEKLDVRDCFARCFDSPRVVH